MPLYDCGAPDCEECQRAFNDRTMAILNYKAREAAYAEPAQYECRCGTCGNPFMAESKHRMVCNTCEMRPLSPDDEAKIDAAWKRHIAVVPGSGTV